MIITPFMQKDSCNEMWCFSGMSLLCHGKGNAIFIPVLLVMQYETWPRGMYTTCCGGIFHNLHLYITVIFWGHNNTTVMKLFCTEKGTSRICPVYGYLVVEMSNPAHNFPPKPTCNVAQIHPCWPEYEQAPTLNAVDFGLYYHTAVLWQSVCKLGSQLFMYLCHPSSLYACTLRYIKIYCTWQ